MGAKFSRSKKLSKITPEKSEDLSDDLESEKGTAKYVLHLLDFEERSRIDDINNFKLSAKRYVKDILFKINLYELALIIRRYSIKVGLDTTFFNGVITNNVFYRYNKNTETKTISFSIRLGPDSPYVEYVEMWLKIASLLYMKINKTCNNKDVLIRHMKIFVHDNRIDIFLQFEPLNINTKGFKNDEEIIKIIINNKNFHYGIRYSNVIDTLDTIAFVMKQKMVESESSDSSYSDSSYSSDSYSSDSYSGSSSS